MLSRIQTIFLFFLLMSGVLASRRQVFSAPPSANSLSSRFPSIPLLLDEETPYVPDRLLVQFAPGTSEEEKAALHQRLGAQVVEEIPALGIQVLQVPEDATSMVYAYQAERVVTFAEPNYIAHVAGWPDGPALSGAELANQMQSLDRTPNDPQFPNQWNLHKIRAEQAWEVTTGDPGVIIAVIDTGVDSNHPDLQGKLVPAYDFVNGDNDPEDDQGHGTHVAGTAAALTNNGLGIAGLGWQIKIMPIKALDANGAGAHSWIANGIVWATDHGADVINLSLGGAYTSATMRSAIDYAWQRGVVVVAAAGNNNSSNPTYPAAYENVIGVSATTQNDQRAGFSNYGSYIDVASPGVSIMGPVRGSGFQAWSGTSMATPHVSALAALLKSVHSDWDNSQIREVIRQSGVDLGTAGWDAVYGYGRIDALNAVTFGGVAPTATPEPSPTPTVGTGPGPAPDIEQQLVDAINRERGRLGLHAFRRDERLIAAARRHSQDMVHSGACSHTGSDGSNPFDRIRESGYPMLSGSEVIACGYQTPDDVVQGWLNSPGHRAIILSETLVDIGCGMAETSNRTRYWTCNPARSSSSGAPSPAPPTPTPVSPTPTPPTPVPTVAPPTATPSPDPTEVAPGVTVRITPQASAVGWVVSNETSGNHFGDDDIYAGIHGGQVYLGAIQFDLSAVPGGARIDWARLTLTGQTREFVGDRGSWTVSLLQPQIDDDWTQHGYLQIRDAGVEEVLLPILGNSDLQPGREITFNFNSPQIRALETRVNSSRRASFRVDGPADGPNNLFSFDSGYGSGGYQKPPVLTIHYTMESGAEPPPPAPPEPTVTPTATATPEPSPTPTPGEVRVLDLRPAENAVGWVASHQPFTNNFGDDDIYAGWFNNNIYLGAFQFDLSALPADAEIVDAELLLTGQTRQYLSGEGVWQVEMLSHSVDGGWPARGYTDIHQAASIGALLDLEEGDFALQPRQLDVEKVNRLGLRDNLLTELNSRRQTSGAVSFRVLGPTSGESNVFSWDSGYGEESLRKPPVLRIWYRGSASVEPSPTPLPTATPSPVAPGDETAVLIQAINAERASRGLGPLTIDERLMTAARLHTEDLAINNRWSHTGSDGSTPQERMRRAGYPLGEGDEVLAANSDDPYAILAAWLRNPRHEGILMDPAFVHIGAAHMYNADSNYGDYWTVKIAHP